MAVELPAHVWVDDGQQRVAGLLFEWRRHPDGMWQGNVVALGTSGEPVMYWVNADRLSAAR